MISEMIAFMLRFSKHSESFFNILSNIVIQNKSTGKSRRENCFCQTGPAVNHHERQRCGAGCSGQRIEPRRLHREWERLNCSVAVAPL